MRIAIIGKDPFAKVCRTCSVLDLFASTGFNTGNLAFFLATHHMIKGNKIYFDWDFDPSVLNGDFDATVLVCANMINPDLDLSGLAERLDALTIPLCVFSIGCQGPIGSTQFDLTPGTLRFLSVVAIKCRSFGVRGKTSADFLSSIGITNWRIIGCPSNFLRGPDEAQQRMRERMNSHGPVLLHVDLIPELGGLLAKFRALTSDLGCRYIVQSPYSLVDLALTSTSDGLDADKLGILELFGLRRSEMALAFIRNSLKVFFSVLEWSAYTKGFNFSLGARLHGNIIALRCGVPSMVVVHDERMRELAETLMVPYMVLEEFLTARSVVDLKRFVANGMDAYWRQSTVLEDRFVSLLKDNGIPVTREMEAI